MRHESTDAAALVATLAESARTKAVQNAAGEHLAAEQLVAYHEGSLAAAEESRVQDHLVSCRVCARQMLDLEAFLSADAAEEDDEGASPPAVSRPEFGRPASERRVAPPPPAGRWSWPRSLSLAASLLLPVTILCFLGWQRPQPVVLGEELRSSGVTVVEIDRWTLFVQLEIAPDVLDPQAFASFQVALLDGGEELWRSDDLELAADGWLELRRSRWSFPAGDHRLRVEGFRDRPSSRDGPGRDEAEVVKEQRLRIEHRSSPPKENDGER